MKSVARHGWQFVSNSGGGREHSARRLKFALLPRFTRLALTDDDGLQFLVRTDDMVIGRDLYTGVSHEVGVHTMTSVIEAVAAEVGADYLTGKVFLDIGANIGTSSIAAVKRFGAGRAVSVEPSPDNVRLLHCNVALNDARDQVTVIQAAVSNSEGELQLELNPLNQGETGSASPRAPASSARASGRR